jgi:hypothetical protein
MSTSPYSIDLRAKVIKYLEAGNCPFLKDVYLLASEIQEGIKFYAIVDDFCKIYQQWIKRQLLQNNKQRLREGKLSISEAVSIMIFYHFSPYKNFKLYYNVAVISGNLFKNPLCYDRFIQIIPSLFMPLIIMLHYMSGNKTGIYYVDSTHFAVCKNIRISSNRTFAVV